MPITKITCFYIDYRLILVLGHSLGNKQLVIENKKHLFEQAKHAHPIVMATFEEFGHLSQVKFVLVILVDAANPRVVQTFFGHR